MSNLLPQMYIPGLCGTLLKRISSPDSLWGKPRGLLPITKYCTVGKCQGLCNIEDLAIEQSHITSTVPRDNCPIHLQSLCTLDCSAALKQHLSPQPEDAKLMRSDQDRARFKNPRDLSKVYTIDWKNLGKWCASCGLPWAFELSPDHDNLVSLPDLNFHENWCLIAGSLEKSFHLRHHRLQYP